MHTYVCVCACVFVCECVRACACVHVCMTILSLVKHSARFVCLNSAQLTEAMFCVFPVSAVHCRSSVFVSPPAGANEPTSRV